VHSQARGPRLLADMGESNKSIRIGFVLTLPILFAVAVGPVAAVEGNVAILDSSKILQGTHEGKRLTDTLNDYIATRQKVLSTDADDIKSLNDELTALGEMLSPEAREEKQSTGRRKVAALEQQTQQFNRDVDDKKRTLLQGFTQQLVEIAARIAQTNGFTLVLDKADRGAGTGIVYSSATDITDQVIKEFDRLAK